MFAWGNQTIFALVIRSVFVSDARL
jgi:hypothetical protein